MGAILTCVIYVLPTRGRLYRKALKPTGLIFLEPYNNYDCLIRVYGYRFVDKILLNQL